MNKRQKETLQIRIISTAFTVLALFVFKPFGIDALQWQSYFHLLMLGVLGLGVCMLTDTILVYLLKMPNGDGHDSSYIIHRNLWFQLVNTPLVALTICLYRHFVLSGSVEGNRLSLGNYLQTLVIIAFCSFAIGLYWRFKFRSRHLAAELEETRQLNEQLKSLTSVPLPKVEGDGEIVLTGTTAETLSLQASNLLYIEAVGNYVKVYHLLNGEAHNDMLRATSKQMEDELSAYPMIIRCHRAFLVNLQQVERVVSNAGNMQLIAKCCHDAIPVSRSNASQVKEAIKRM